MDSSELVEQEEIDAGQEFVRLLDKTLPVKVAFWLKPSDERWWLYIASEQIVNGDVKHGYQQVVAVARAMNNPYLDSSRVKLIAADNSLARAALSVQQRYPGRMGTRYNGRILGDMSIDGAYIYPTLIATPAN